MRMLIDRDPFITGRSDVAWRERGLWPACWVNNSGATVPFVAAFRLKFSVSGETRIRFHVSADERYDLFLDGRRLGRGPERGAPDAWYFDTYELDFSKGAHVLVARVWALGHYAPDAQMSVRPGFLLAAEGAWETALSTGHAPWESRLLTGYTFTDPPSRNWKGPNTCLDGASFPWGFACGEGSGWSPVTVLNRGIAKRIDWELTPAHILTPATLPPMLDQPMRAGSVCAVDEGVTATSAVMPYRDMRTGAGETQARVATWNTFLEGQTAITLAPATRIRVLVDLQDYFCAYPELVVSGGQGSRVHVRWAEALYETVTGPGKGHRSTVEGKFFRGEGDVFLPDGGSNRTFDTLWWQAGRFIELAIETGEHPLRLERFMLRETRYPVALESRFAASDARLEGTIPLLTRGMQMCSHETFFDCPYYEEMMYVGDTRLEALITFVISRDDRLVRKALQLFDHSRLASGLTQSRYPCRIPQIIASWTLWWVAMVCDYAVWRDDRAFVLRLMPGVRATMEGFRRYYGADGLLHAPDGWNSFDWVPEWDHEAGCPPDAVSGVSGVLNWHLVYVLKLYADLERNLGESLLAERAEQHARELADRVTQAFWDEARGLMADDLAHRYFSEHSQCLALLSGCLDPLRQARVVTGLLTALDLQRATVYFSHYLFEVFGALDRVDALFARLPLWFDMVEQGFKTPLEQPEPSRSDCHGWGSHPLFHYFATILGIRPAGLGFRRVTVTPRLGPLQAASGRMVHPSGGEITLDVRREGALLHGVLSVPAGVEAVLHVNEQALVCRPGRNSF